MAAEEFDPDAFLAAPDASDAAPTEFDPDAFLADEPQPEVKPAAPAELDTLTGQPTNFVQPARRYQLRPAPAQDFVRQEQQPLRSEVDLAVQRREEKLAMVKWAMGVAQEKGNEKATALTIARAFNMPLENVEPNLDAFRRSYAASKESPEQWLRDNPQLGTYLTENPDAAALVVSDKPLSALTRQLANAWDFWWTGQAAAVDQRHAQSPEERKLAASVTTVSEAADALKAEQRLIPQQQTERDDAEAAAVRESSVPGAVAYRRGLEAAEGLNIATKYHQLMMAKLRGQDTTALEADIYKAERANVPLALGEGEYEQILSDAATGTASTLKMLETVAERGGALGLAGAVVGGAAGALLTKSPAGAYEGAVGFGAAMAKIGGVEGAVEASYVMEAGSAYKELGDVVTDSGEPLTEMERAGASIIIGSLNAGLEMLELRQLLSTMGPLKQVLKEGGIANARRLLTQDANFRTLAARAGAQLLESSVKEAGEEAAQTAVKQGVTYVAKSKHDAAWQAGPALNTEEIASDFATALPATLPLGLLGTGSQLTAAALFRQQQDRSKAQLKAILEAGQHELWAQDPAGFAQVVLDATSEKGKPVVSLFLDPGAVVRYFQGKDEVQRNAELTDTLGPEAPRLLEEALAQGGKLEVPMAQVGKAFAKSEMAEALKRDVSTGAAELTANEVKAEKAATDEATKQLVESEKTRLADLDVATTEFDRMEEDLEATGRPAQQVRDAMRVWRAFYETQAQRAGVPLAQLLDSARVHFGLEQAEVAAEPESVKRLRADFLGSSPLDQERAMFIDPVTGVLNRRAFEATKPEGRQVAVISPEGVKFLNDSLGHVAGNSPFIAAAQALAPLSPEVAKVGGDFAVYVRDQAELDQLLAEANKSPGLGGTQLTGALGADLRTASAMNNAAKAAAERAGKRAPRGSRPLGVKETKKPKALKAGPVLLHPVPKALSDSLRGVKPSKSFGQIYVEKGTGLLTRDGWGALPRKENQASLDLNGIKELNDVLGEATTDAIIEAFGKALSELGGGEFDAAHMSGDEYAAQHDDEAKLKGWLDTARRALEGAQLDVELTPAAQKKLGLDQPGATVAGLLFGAGVGKDVDHAEAELKADKARLAAEGKRGPGTAARRVVGRVARPAGGVGEGNRAAAQRQDVPARRLNQDELNAGPLWFSTVEAAVAGAKQAKNTAAAWLAQLKKATGVKQEELDFLGLPEWLTQQKGSVDREAIAEFLKANRVEVTETVEGASDLVETSDLSELVDHAVGWTGLSWEKVFQSRNGAEWALDGDDARALAEAVENVRAAEQEAADQVDNDEAPEEVDPRDVDGVDAHSARIISRLGLENAGDIAAEGVSYARQVETEASRAARAGRAGLAAARRGDWGEARDKLELAKDIEAEFGAAPNWQPVIDWLNDLPEEPGAASGTQYAEWQLKGAKPTPGSYRELLFRTPAAKSFKSAHFDSAGKGLLAHARISEHLIDGKPVLFVEEIQSDLHQDGREKGYERRTKAVGPIPEERRGSVERRPPAAPFRATWEELVAKRLVRWAADNGYTKIAWTTGEQQAERYDLQTVADEVLYYPEAQQLEVIKDGSVVTVERNVSPERLPAYVGEAIAARVLNSSPIDYKVVGDENGWTVVRDGRGVVSAAEGDTFETKEEAERAAAIRRQENGGGALSAAGGELKIGGEGMKAAYDVRIPSVFKKLTKEKPQKEKLDSGPEVWSVNLPPELLETARTRGMPLFQGDESKQAGPRGFIELPSDPNAAKRAYKIFLTPTADASTVLHESAHAFLEIFGKLASDPTAPHALRDDWEATLKYLGVPSRSAIGTAQHEKWARSFEAYLMEGKSPSPALRKAFSRFLVWLKGIYRTVDALDVELSPSIRRVFDRLLATDEEIAANQPGRPLVTPVERGTMDEAAWAIELAKQADDAEQLGDRVRKAAMADLVATTEKVLDGYRAEEEMAAEKAYDELPGRRAQRLIAGQLDLPGGSEPIALGREAVQTAVGDALKGKVRTEANGANVDDVAQVAGFPTGRAMLEAIATLPPRAKWVRSTVDAAMARKHPGVLEDRSKLADAAFAAQHGESLLARLEREWAALRARGKPPLEAIKRAAIITANGRALNRIGVGPVLAAERKAADEKARAAAAGNPNEAVAWARQQLSNMYLGRELRVARKDKAATEDLAKRLSKTAARAKLGKASPVYRDAVDYLLNAVGLTEREGVEVGPEVLEAAAAVMTSEALDPGTWVEDLGSVLGGRRGNARQTFAPTIEWNNLTVTGMRAVKDALTQIETAASWSSEVKSGEEMADKAFVTEQLVREAVENKRPVAQLASSTSAETAAQWLARLPAVLSGPLLKPETMVEWLAGGLKGKDVQAAYWYRYVIKPMQDAKVKESDTLKRAGEPALKAFQAMPKAVLRCSREHFDGAKAFPFHTVDRGQNLSPPTRRFELLMMALNAGNASNLNRLLGGRGITVEELHRAMDDLTAEEIGWVNGVWEAFESLKKETFDVEEKASGLRPKGFTPTPIRLANGTLTGGYFPAIYDRRVEAAGEKQALTQVAQLMDPTYTGVGVPHSHTKSRVEGFTGVIQLEPSAVPINLVQAAHYIAFREVMKNVGGLLLSPTVQAVLNERLGVDRAVQFRQWLQDVGTARGVDGAVHAGVYDQVVRKLRAGAVVSSLGYSIPPIIEDASNLPAALARTDLKSRFLNSALLEMMAHPRDTIAAVEAKSGTIRAANDQRIRDLTRSIAHLTRRGGAAGRLLDFINSNGFIGMEYSFKATATPVWLGMYRQNIAAGKSEEYSVEAADRAVRKVFPIHNAVDTAGILRDRGFVGRSLMFFGFQSTAANASLDFLQQFAEGDTAGAKARPLARWLAYMAVIGGFGAFLHGQGPDDDESWAEWFTRKTLLAGLAQIPGGDVAENIYAVATGKPSQTRPNFLVSMGENAAKAVSALADEEKSGVDTTAAVIRALGPVFGVAGTSQLLRFVKAATAEEPAAGPLSEVSDAVFGRRKGTPLTPLNFVEQPPRPIF